MTTGMLRGRVRRLPTADLVITTALGIIFTWAFLAASEWSLNAALFPRLVTGLGIGLALLRLVRLLVKSLADAETCDTAVEGESDDLEYAFANASGQSWARALAWVLGFFVSLYVLGIFVTGPLFALLYLRFSARASWTFSGVYATVTGVSLYAAFEWALSLPTPSGILM